MTANFFKDMLDAGYEAVDVYRVSSTIITASEVEKRRPREASLVLFPLPSSLVAVVKIRYEASLMPQTRSVEKVLACVGGSTLILIANLFSAEEAGESSNRACTQPGASIKYEQAV
jgi:hypothetical protein